MMKWMTKHWMLTLWAISFIFGFIISGDLGGAVYVGLVAGFILFYSIWFNIFNKRY